MSWQQSNDFGNFTCNISLQLELNALYKPLSTTAVHHQMQRCSGNSRNSKVSETNGIWSHQPLHRIMLVVLETQHDQSKDHQNFQRQLGLKVRTNLSPWSPQSQRHHLDTSWRKSFLNFCYAYRLTLCMLLEGFHISNSVLLPGYCCRNHLISIVEPMHPAAKSPASDSRFTGIPAFWWSTGSILALWAIQKFMYWGEAPFDFRLVVAEYQQLASQIVQDLEDQKISSTLTLRQVIWWFFAWSCFQKFVFVKRNSRKM